MAAHIRVMEPELCAAATVDISNLIGDSAAEGAMQLAEAMRIHGFAIVANVVPQEEIPALEALWVEDLLSIVDIPTKEERERHAMLQDPLRRWDIDAFPLSAKKESFASEYGLPHGRCAWAVRQHPQVRIPFEALFGTSELCVGMDNVFFKPTPPLLDDDAERADRLWPHADQCSHIVPSGKYDCYQGVVYLWGADCDASATVVWPGSHATVFPDMMRDHTFRSHFCRLDPARHHEFVVHARRVCVPAGGMLLWSSKTIHQGWTHGRRLAVPVSFEPTKRRDAAALASKIKCCLEGIPTSHWASLGIPHPIAHTGGPGGTAEVPLVHRAHHHILTEDHQSVIPAVLALL